MLKKLTVIFLILLFSSCGIVTKTRYGNGLKWNLEVFSNPKNEKCFEENHAKVAEKKFPETYNDSGFKVNNIEKLKNDFDENPCCKFELKSKINKPNTQKSKPISIVTIKKNLIKNEYEPKAILSFLIFFLSIIGAIGIAYWISIIEFTLTGVFIVFILSFVFLFFLIMLVVGYSMALHSRTIINESNGKLKGKVLVNMVVFVPFIALLALFLILISME